MSKTMPLVSVIVPIYNVELYLKQCIESIVCQDYSNLQIILVNDGSTDSCASLCDEYVERDKRVYVVHKANGGLATALNAGMDASQGEWIMVVDGDDYLEPDAVDKMLNEAQNGHCDIFIGSYYMDYADHSEHRTFLSHHHYELWGKETLELVKESLAYSPLSSKKSGMKVRVTWGKLYNKKFLVENHCKFLPHLSRTQDMIFNLRAFYMAQHIAIKDIPVYHYRMRKSAVTKKYSSSFTHQAIEILNASMDFIKHYELEKELGIFYNGEAISKMLEIIRLVYALDPKLNYRVATRELRKIAKLPQFSCAFKISTFCTLNFKRKCLFFLLLLRQYTLLILIFRKKLKTDSEFFFE
jgi:glycosyltransferase involved in cell wall biosynthesis